MKLNLILPVLAASALAANVQLDNGPVKALLGRAIDPNTMDPVRLSVLSVLKTAMPTGTNAALPTGDVQPEWYAKLPADVKALLPSLYPGSDDAEAAATGASTEASIATPSPPVVSPGATWLSSGLSSTAALVSLSTLRNASSTTPQIPITKTLPYSPTATAGTNPTLLTSMARSTNGTLPLATPSPSPSPSGLFSAGAKTAIGMEMLAAIVWLGVGMGFFIFA